MSKSVKETIQTLRNRLPYVDTSYNEGYIEALEHVEQALQVDNEPTYPLLEQSGYSYSGIAELIRDHPENRKTFIRELHTAHSVALERIQALEGQLHSARIDVALLVQSYRAVNKIVNQGSESMCYELDGLLYVVTFGKEGIEQFKTVI